MAIDYEHLRPILDIIIDETLDLQEMFIGCEVDSIYLKVKFSELENLMRPFIEGYDVFGQAAMVKDEKYLCKP